MSIEILFNAEGQADLLGNPLATQVRLRRFISTTASISSLVGPLGPGFRTRLGETAAGTSVS